MQEKEIRMDFHEAWSWLNDHPLFTSEGIGGSGVGCLYIEVVRVNPDNETIEDNEWLNTTTRVWLEGGPWERNLYEGTDLPPMDGWSHDINLDCGAPTFEEALLKFVELVKKHYGEYGEYSSYKYGDPSKMEDFLRGVNHD